MESIPQPIPEILPVAVDEKPVTAPPPPPPYATGQPSTTEKKYHLIPDINDFNENIDDVDKGVHDYIWTHHRTLYLGSWIGSVSLCIALFGLEILYLAPTMQSIGEHDGRVYLLPLIVLSWPVGIYTHFKLQMQHLFMQQIAQVLGFTYAGKGDLTSVTSKILNAGHDNKMDDAMVGIYQGYPMRVYNYTFTIEYGKSAHTKEYTVFELTFDKKLPDIVLRPVMSLSIGGFSVTPNISSSNETSVRLEGDFNKYFNLETPKGYDMEIRVIFQPDLMAELIDKYQRYSVEIFQNKLYVFATTLTKKTDFLATHDLIDSLFTKILPYIQEVGV